MRIIELQAENVKRLRAVRIRPDGSPLVIIGGENAQGKSSILDSIFYALGGASAIPEKPVRDGEAEATIKLDLGEYIVERTIRADGKSSLKVASKDGARFPSPQALLDSLVGGLSFDPLEFSRMDPRRQTETLKALVGLDFSAIDRQRAAKAEMRTIVGREVKQLEGQLAGMKQHAGVPAAEVSIVELTGELNQARDQNTHNTSLQFNAKRAEQIEIERAQHVVDLEARLIDAKKTMAESARLAQEARDAAAKCGGIDESAIIARMSECEATNRKVRENRDRKRVATDAYNKQAAYEKLSAELAEIDAQKADALAAAKFPVPGLSFDETGVKVAGVPFQQASAAEQLKISVGMGLALNPKLKVLLVRDGSLLDAKSLAMLGAMADEAGAQVWLERVSDRDEAAVIIEDGMVRA